MTDALHIWTIYDHPRDYPKHFVARRSVIGPAARTAPAVTIQGDTLDAVRRAVQDRCPYVLTIMPRAPEDDPCIVECWL